MTKMTLKMLVVLLFVTAVLGVVTAKFCPDYHICNDANTCCPVRHNTAYACCGYTNGVCCPDEKTCCPKDTYCLAGGFCMSSLKHYNSYWSWLVYAFRLDDEARAAPLQESIEPPTDLGVTLQTGEDISQLSQAAVLTPSQLNTTAVTYHLCPDGYTYCHDEKTCCLMTDGFFGCCSLNFGVCCQYTNFCCPQGTYCTDDGSCE